MRLTEFVSEDESQDQSGSQSNIATALSLLQNRIQSGHLKPDLPTDLVIRYIRNTGLNGFSYEDLVAANETDTSIQNILKKITPDTITVTTSQSQTVSNPEEYTSSANNPEQTVSNMAKSAAKRRQTSLV